MNLREAESPDAHEARLAPYANTAATSRGRRYAEPAPRDRSDYQRDRDRIIHCSAFRRLEYKTQVFLNHEGDLFRTRLTHSLEVAQIARSIARALRLNEDLTEAIALAHDLGHTPFGHAGQDALNDCMRSRALQVLRPRSEDGDGVASSMGDMDGGGFEHNLQSLRVVDKLEERYAAFDGLNLTFETREGILKHCSRRNAAHLGEVAARFLHGGQPSLEAQVANLADEIAYNNHDIDDGLRSGLLQLDQLEAIGFFGGHLHAVRAAYPGLVTKRLVAETIRRMISALIADLVAQTQANIVAAGVQSPAEVRAGAPLVGFSAPVREQLTRLQQFLRQALYRHPQVLRSTTKAARVLRELFTAYADEPRLLPFDHQRPAGTNPLRAIADYIAGMTDRYAIKEHRKLFSVQDW
uniref:Putative Deoxyguanosinetriphosphate triphosphohydrolase n=1 Tax=mine drainage metagenome TaxID=410659 RepID=E6PVG7_9ZZZZ